MHPASAASNPRRCRVSQGRILVVDDEPQIRRMMRTVLVAHGFEVTDARTGGEALEKLQSSKYDVVLLDINMPGITGIKTCTLIRARSDVPIIMLTVRRAEKDKTTAFNAGADDYVTKPFNMPELLARIRARLRRSAQLSTSTITHLRLGKIEVDFESRQVKGGVEPVRLTPK